MSFEKLEIAIKYYNWDHPSYDKSRVIDIYNKLSDEDKKQANVQFKDTLLAISALSKVS